MMFAVPADEVHKQVQYRDVNTHIHSTCSYCASVTEKEAIAHFEFFQWKTIFFGDMEFNSVGIISSFGRHLFPLSCAWLYIHIIIINMILRVIIKITFGKQVQWPLIYRSSGSVAFGFRSGLTFCMSTNHYISISFRSKLFKSHSLSLWPIQYS